MSDVTNCRRCGRLFNYITGQRICPACKQEIEEKFEEVKKYIQENRTASMKKITEDCNVDANQVQMWIRQERLQFADDSPIKVNCEKCGKMIASGRFCETCRNQMASNLNNMMTKSTATLKEEARKGDPSKNRMRFLQK